MKQALVGGFATLVALLVLDGIWLGLVMKDFVREQLGPLMLETPRFGVAALFYVLYAAGIWFFAVRPVADEGIGRAALLGAALGFVAYMTYDLTNAATLRGWSTTFSVVDVAWGTFATAVAAAAGAWAASKVG